VSALEVRDLHLRVGGRQVLKRESLDLQRGEIGVLSGPSGSGKSALLRLLLGLRPRASELTLSGAARTLGMDALATPTARLARRAGLLFQDAALQLTQPDVAGELAFRPENLGLAARDVEARVEGVARRFGLGHLLARSAGELSGGETKRVALAAVLAAEPEALLLDEPLGGLDAAWRRALLDDLRREATGRAVLVVEHRSDDLGSLRPRRFTLGGGAMGIPRGHRLKPRRRATHEEPPWPLVRTEGVAARRGGQDVLRGIDLDLGPGVALLQGPNGAGKTSLLRALAGLVPFDGEARVAGLDPRDAPPHRLGKVLGYVPQRPEDLFSEVSVRDELGFSPRRLGVAWGDASATALAERWGLSHLLDRHPLTLSGGEQQRVALACALAHGPRVLLLDEPTVGLDAAGLAQALDAIDAARTRVAVLVASHDPELVALADRVLTLDAGRLREKGALEATA
jgi:energy-coupling factor transporter ATP-binding protein EcfA2